MISLYNFINLASKFSLMDDYYKINIFDTNTGEEVLHQVEVRNIKEELEKIDRDDLLNNNNVSWDITEENNNELTIKAEYKNIEGVEENEKK